MSKGKKNLCPVCKVNEKGVTAEKCKSCNIKAQGIVIGKRDTSLVDRWRSPKGMQR